MAIPTFVSSTGGAYGNPTNPTMAPGWQVGDLLIISVFTERYSCTTPSGWNLMTGFPIENTGSEVWEVPGGDHAVRLYVFWRRAQAGDTSPSMTIGGSSAYSIMQAFRGVAATGNPWDVIALGGAIWSTPVSVPGATTTGPDRLINIIAATSQRLTRSNWTNASLGSLTETHDNPDAWMIGTANGTKATAGSFGTTTFDLSQSAVSNSIGAAIALMPPPPVQSSFVADAILRKEVISTFSADSILLTTVNGTFTSDSVFLKTVDSSFVADSILLRTVSGSFSSDSIIQKTVTGSFTADARFAMEIAATIEVVVTSSNIGRG